MSDFTKLSVLEVVLLGADAYRKGDLPAQSRCLQELARRALHVESSAARIAKLEAEIAELRDTIAMKVNQLAVADRDLRDAVRTLAALDRGYCPGCYGAVRADCKVCGGTGAKNAKEPTP